MKTFCVGDLHGSLNSLLQGLERANFDNKEDKLIFLGDYCDGYSQTSELVDFLIELQKESGDRHIFLSGNHDVWMKEWMNLGTNEPIWMHNGGISTVESYLKNGKNLDKEHRDFFNNLRKHYVDEENRCFVHAGLESIDGVEDDGDNISFWDREFWWLQLHNPEYKLNPAKNYSEVFIGHTPTINYPIKNHYPERKLQETNGGITVPMNRGNVWNLDTGCGWGEKLTLMNIDTKEFFQSDKSETLHPGDRGRKG